MIPLRPPQQKKSIRDIKLINLPIFNENGIIFEENEWPSFQAIFNGKNIIINDSNDISRLKQFGSFGEFGVFDKNTLIDYRTLQNQLLKHKKNWQSMELVPFEFPHNNTVKRDKNQTTKVNKYSSKQYAENRELFKLFKKKFNHIQDSSDGNLQQSSNNFNNLSDNWKSIRENFTKDFCNVLILSGENSFAHYYLLLEEAFFLSYTLECLEIRNENGSVVSESECWQQFNSLKEDFPFYYVAYHYYRSKGWIVKLGYQYGGNYVLYKASPGYYHSSFVVVISINGQNNELLSSWPSFFGSNRVIESANKNLLACTVYGPPYKEGMHIDLTMYTVLDTIVRRFVPEQHRLKPTN